jgi:aminoglycoside/choline kinase family phosphotransferase/molybdopterin-guanine dinucleotide biosynthesis protein A
MTADGAHTADAREQLRRDFLARAALADTVRTRMSGDASTRSYERLTLAGGGTRILMDAPPAAESEPAGPETSQDQRRAMGYNALARLAAGRVDAFAGLPRSCAPAACPRRRWRRWMSQKASPVLEDLGDDLFARKIADGEPATPLYADAVDVLVRLQSEPPPVWLEYDSATGSGRWPLLSYDDLALQTGCNLFLEWWPKYAGLPAFSAEAEAEWTTLWAPIRAAGHRAATGPDGVFTHRDYHAENLLWLPQRRGLARVGLLDFQDAVKAHPAWDLLHLLQDARRDVAPELAAAMLDRYLDARPELERDSFRREYRWSGGAERGADPVHLRAAGGGLRQSRGIATSSRGPGRRWSSTWLSRGWRTCAAGSPATSRRRRGMSEPLSTAMVLAAGLGTRMRPLTDDRPKALVEVGGKPLVDHMLDRLAAGGVTRAVVNLHAFADRLEAHLRARTDAPALQFSDERAAPLETGGGIRHARPLLGDAPVLVANIDSVWIETGRPAVADLRAAFDPERMDALLLLTPTESAMGFDRARRLRDGCRRQADAAPGCGRGDRAVGLYRRSRHPHRGDLRPASRQVQPDAGHLGPDGRGPAGCTAGYCRASGCMWVTPRPATQPRRGCGSDARAGHWHRGSCRWPSRPMPGCSAGPARAGATSPPTGRSSTIWPAGWWRCCRRSDLRPCPTPSS